MSAIKTDTKNVPKVVVLIFEIDFGWVYIDLDGLNHIQIFQLNEPTFQGAAFISVQIHSYITAF